MVQLEVLALIMLADTDIKCHKASGNEGGQKQIRS